MLRSVDCSQRSISCTGFCFEFLLTNQFFLLSKSRVHMHNEQLSLQVKMKFLLLCIHSAGIPVWLPVIWDGSPKQGQLGSQEWPFHWQSRACSHSSRCQSTHTSFHRSFAENRKAEDLMVSVEFAWGCWKKLVTENVLKMKEGIFYDFKGLVKLLSIMTS